MGFKLALHRCLSLLLALGVALCMVLSAVPLCAFASQQDQGQQQSGKVVRIGLFEDTYHKVDANGQLYGYGYEYLQKIVSYTGWTLEYVQADWSTCFDKLENGEIDILNGISWTAEREQDMLFSSLPMAQERYFIYADSRNMKIDPADVGSIDGKTVGVMEGAVPEDVLCKWEEENGLSAAHIKISTAQDVIKKLDKGKMDCFLSRTGTSRVYAKDSECQVNMLVSDISTSFAVERENTVLLSILNKTIEAMPADMLSDALVAYDNETDNVTLFEFVRDNLAEVIFAVLGIALVIAVISLALRRSKAAERELTAAKLDADKANAAKTDFLRRMSHDIRTPINGIRGMVQIANSNMDDRGKLEDCRDKIWKATDHLLSLVNDVQLSRDAGMDEHLTKPLREEEIVRALSKHVGR